PRAGADPARPRGAHRRRARARLGRWRDDSIAARELGRAQLRSVAGDRGARAGSLRGRPDRDQPRRDPDRREPLTSSGRSNPWSSAMLPVIAALYRDARSAACVRGDRVSGCLVEPIWVWSTFGAGSSIPRACRTTRGVRVGPLTPAQQSLIEESLNVL